MKDNIIYRRSIDPASATIHDQETKIGKVISVIAFITAIAVLLIATKL